MTGFIQDLLQDAAGAFFGSDYLRDYTHASKTFRTNAYQNAPKLKFLFHTYFEINPAVYFPGSQTNYGLLVKEVKLPSFSFSTYQMNQYNRKRIIQTKIKYEPIEITFHDDTANQVNKMWEAYYVYYYNDGARSGSVLAGDPGSPPGANGPRDAAYNDRNIYQNSPAATYDWGLVGGTGGTPTDVQANKKVPFFKRITVFGFDQHKYTAYTLINPIITNFSHDSYNYAEGAGTMANRMTVDYETVLYNNGGMDGRTPGNIVTSFGDPANYDTTLSPIAKPGSQGTIFGQGGLVDAAGGFVNSLNEGNPIGAIMAAGTAYNTFKNTNLALTAKTELNTMLVNSVQNTPNTRNTLFNFPTARSTPGPAGLAASPVIGAVTSAITGSRTAGTQNNS